MYQAIFVNEWPWWAGGIVLGSFVVFYTWVYNRLIGMSSTLEYSMMEFRQPLIAKEAPAMSMEQAALAMAREAGIDPATLGLDVATIEKEAAGATKSPIVFHPRMITLGVLFGAVVAGLLSGATVQFGLGPEFNSLFAFGPIGQAAVFLAGGFCIGFGARMAGGCPSGHALGGLSVISPSSFVAIIGYFVSGIGLTFVLKWLAA